MYQEVKEGIARIGVRKKEAQMNHKVSEGTHGPLM